MKCNKPNCIICRDTHSIEELEGELSRTVSARDLTIRDLRAERDEAIHIARDLLTWAEASGVAAGAVIEARSRLGKLRPREG